MKVLTRRELAEYAAEQLAAGNTDVVGKLAAYLVQAHRTREARLVVRDIESALARRGVVVAHVGVAHPLEGSARAALEAVLTRTFDARQLHLDESVQPELLGGIKVAAADMELDSTARRRLNQLKAVKV